MTRRALIPMTRHAAGQASVPGANGPFTGPELVLDRRCGPRSRGGGDVCGRVCYYK